MYLEVSTYIPSSTPRYSVDLGHATPTPNDPCGTAPVICQAELIWDLEAGRSGLCRGLVVSMSSATYLTTGLVQIIDISD